LLPFLLDRVAPRVPPFIPLLLLLFQFFAFSIGVPQPSLEIPPFLAEVPVFASHRQKLVVHTRAVRNSLLALGKKLCILQVETVFLFLRLFVSLLNIV